MLWLLVPCGGSSPQGIFLFLWSFATFFAEKGDFLFLVWYATPRRRETPKGGSKMDELNTKYRDLLKELASQATERQAELAWIFLSGLIARNA